MATDGNQKLAGENNDANAATHLNHQHLPHAVSLPSIDELVVNQSLMLMQTRSNTDATLHSSPGKMSGFRRHRRVASSVTTTTTRASSVSTSSSSLNKATTSNSNSATTSSSSPSKIISSDNDPASAFQSSSTPLTPLLQNMMRSYKNRNPYKDYLVLGMIGKGSIGSVEKVVRKHHSVISHDQQNLLDDEQELENDEDDGFCSGSGSGCGSGIFNCCHIIASKERKRKAGIFSTLLSLLFNKQSQSKDAFQSKTIPAGNSNNNQQPCYSDTISLVSESSAFSAPTTPTIPHYNQRHATATDDSMSKIRSSSQHGSITTPSSLFHSTHNNAHQHPLRRYALKSIRLDRTIHEKKKKKTSQPSGIISSSDEAELRNEISILRSLDHPHIVHIIETYEYNNLIYMVIDLCENGDLYVLDPYSEGEAKCIMRQLLQAISYMHHRGVVHRDLKVRFLFVFVCCMNEFLFVVFAGAYLG